MIRSKSKRSDGDGQTRLHALAGIPMGGAAFPFHVATDGIGHRCAHQFAGEIFFQRSLGLPRGED